MERRDSALCVVEFWFGHRGKEDFIEKEQEDVDAALWVSPNSKWVQSALLSAHCMQHPTQLTDWL